MVKTEVLREKRRNLRMPITVKVDIVWDEGQFSGYSTDVSTSGIFVETTQLPPIGSVLQLAFTIRGASGRILVQAEGRVARIVAVDEARARGLLPGLGIEFHRFSKGRADLAENIAWRIGLETKAPEPPQEKRKAPRVPIGLPVLWDTTPQPRRKGFVIDVSSTGAYIATREPEAPDTRIYVSLELPVYGVPETVKTIARVVRTNPPEIREDRAEPPGMGIDFELSTIETEDLVRFVGERLARMVRLKKFEQAELEHERLEVQDEPGEEVLDLEPEAPAEPEPPREISPEETLKAILKAAAGAEEKAEQKHVESVFLSMDAVDIDWTRLSQIVGIVIVASLGLYLIVRVFLVFI